LILINICLGRIYIVSISIGLTEILMSAVYIMEAINYSDKFNGSDSDCIEIFDYDNYKKISKRHSVLNKHAITFLVKGSKKVFFSNSTISINNSGSIMMKLGNCLMTEKLSDINKHKSVVMFFSNDLLLGFIRKHKLEINEPAKFDAAFSFRDDVFIKHFMNSLRDISNLPETIRQKMLELKFEEIMHYIIGLYGTGFLSLLICNTSNASRKFIQTVENNKLNKLTLNELAFLCGMSVSTFKREFEKHYSEPPIKWFLNKRLEHAYFLLNQERKNASEIYFDVGYENLSSFIQAYKARYGVTPKQNQKRMSF
jgi:AraC-like DNA-binding protein